MAREKRKELVVGRRAKPSGHTFGEAAQIYRERLRLENKLQRGTEYIIMTLLDRWGKVPLQEITPLEWHRYMVNRFKFRKPGTMARYLTVMNCILRQAVDEGWLVYPPRLKRPRGGAADARTQHLEASEVMPVVEYLRHRYGPLAGFIVLLLTDTGVRWGEANALRWCDMGPEWVVVRLSSYGHSKTKMRRVPTSPRLLKYMKDNGIEKGSAQPIDRIIPSLWNEHQGTVARKLNLAIKEASVAMGCEVGVNFRIHDLRHTFAYLCAEAGAELVDIKELMGHSNIAMTVRYRGFVKSRAGDIIRKGMKE